MDVVVGAYFPTFAGIIMAICCFAVTALQPVGFIGVLRVCPSSSKDSKRAGTDTRCERRADDYRKKHLPIAGTLSSIC